MAVDTSGSVGGETLSRFAAEVQGILEAFDATLTVLYHDARVQHVQTWRTSDGPLVLEPRGGGGTDDAPVFEWVEQNARWPVAVSLPKTVASPPLSQAVVIDADQPQQSFAFVDDDAHQCWVIIPDFVKVFCSVQRRAD
jgi:predicted metal-dependent peptidase